MVEKTGTKPANNKSNFYKAAESIVGTSYAKIGNESLNSVEN